MTSPQTDPVAASSPHPPGTRDVPTTGSTSGRWWHGSAGSRLPWLSPLGLVAAYGVIAGLWTPRGPTTTFEALAAMLLSALVGLYGGWRTRTRWSALAMPAVFVLVFELVRAGTSGPTVDGVHLGSAYGVIAFAVGRGVHGLLALLPMAVFTLLGAAVARRKQRDSRAWDLGTSAGAWIRRGGLAAGIASVAVLALLVARPAATDPILDAHGDPVPGSVAELSRVDMGDHELALMIRGHSIDDPVLLFLAGGPGGSELGAMRRHSEALEDDFVVATLDQRGVGKSYDQLDPAQTLTLDGSVADVLAVADYLRNRFNQEKVYLVGQSWGTLLGVLAVQREPDRFHAFVGAGQMVDPRATDRIFYDDTLQWAREQGDTDLVETLLRNGPPPYADMLDYEPALSHEQEVYPYDHGPNSEGSGQMSENLLVEEYSLLDQVHVLGAFMDVFSVLYPQLQDIDLMSQVRRLDVPVYLAQGRHEAPGRATLADAWFQQLQAPSKTLVRFDTSGHRPLWEQPTEFHALMLDVLAGPEATR